MHWIGAAVLALAGLLMGLCTAENNKRRVRSLESLSVFLRVLSMELLRYKTPLPRLFRDLADRLEGTGGELCRRVAERLAAGKEFLPVWTEALGLLSEEERRALAPLGGVLGRYGAEETEPAVSACDGEIRRCLDKARGSDAEKSRIAVGIYGAGGFLLAVLLL